MLSILQTNHLLADYDRLTRSVHMHFLDRYYAKLVWGVLADARLELARLNPKIPNIGKGHAWQFNLDTSVLILTLYRALKKYSYSLPESVQAIYDIYEAYLTRYFLVLRWGYRRYFSVNITGIVFGVERLDRNWFDVLMIGCLPYDRNTK